MSLIFSPMGVPPGSLTWQTSIWFCLASCAKRLYCVVLPEPSGPSKTMNFPFRACSHVLLVWLGFVCF